MRPRKPTLAHSYPSVFVLGATGDILEREDSWWNGRVVHVQTGEDVGYVGRGTHFVHGEGRTLFAPFAVSKELSRRADWTSGGTTVEDGQKRILKRSSECAMMQEVCRRSQAESIEPAFSMQAAAAAHGVPRAAED